jgi:glycine cleavage system regulatory protein
MVDVELRVLSDRREGLLLTLGQLVIACGYTLLRQRMLNTAEGVVLTMVVRGPREDRLELEERLATHFLVQRFEAISPDDLEEARQPAPTTAAPATAESPATGRG